MEIALIWLQAFVNSGLFTFAILLALHPKAFVNPQIPKQPDS